MTETTESEKELANEVGAQLREKLSQIRGAPGASIGFKVDDGNFCVRVTIERDETYALILGRRVSK